MKKVVALILIFLPIFLVFSISFMGRIYSAVVFVGVESVEFTDGLGETYTGGGQVKLGLGGQLKVGVRVLPELATDKRVYFESTDEAVCTVDDGGLITGIGYGAASLTVRTASRSKTAVISVRVADDYAASVQLLLGGQPLDGQSPPVELRVSDRIDLDAVVSPYTALDKRVVWTSSRPDVAAVSANGRIIAAGEGSATVTATTRDGGHAASCEVVVSGHALIGFNSPAFIAIKQDIAYFPCGGEGLKLSDLLIPGEGISAADLRFTLLQGEELLCPGLPQEIGADTVLAFAANAPANSLIDIKVEITAAEYAGYFRTVRLYKTDG